MNWQPSASLASLREAARLRRSIRSWMEQHDVLEVLTPTLSRAAATDPHVLSMATTDGRYLHTSPEFPMKRLLAAFAADASSKGSAGEGTDKGAGNDAGSDAGSDAGNRAGRSEAANPHEPEPCQPDLYQIATVFRAEESGRFHNPEFTLLEWYRVGLNHLQLIDDLTALLTHIWQDFGKPWPGLEVRCYGEEVHRLLGCWPEELQADTIARYFAGAGRSYPHAIGQDIDAALDLFMDEFVLPDFSSDAFTVLMDYPVSQSALARLGVDRHGRAIAQRFELYCGRTELANGFHELSDALIQRERFEADLQKRDALSVERVPLDDNLLDALAAGLPDCAGIALGLERLHMVLGQYTHIREVVSFDNERA